MSKEERYDFMSRKPLDLLKDDLAIQTFTFVRFVLTLKQGLARSVHRESNEENAIMHLIEAENVNGSGATRREVLVC
jgi:hypothetical protein